MSKPLQMTCDDNDNKSFEFGQVLHTFPLVQGGLFINNTAHIPNKYVFPIINLMANVVRFDDDNTKYTSYNSPVYDVMPSIFVEFANGSRASSGFRLLKRCLRHSFDPKAQSIMNKKATLFIHDKDDEMGIVLENTIPASMKDDEYEVKLALTSKDLIATKCQCHTGGDNE